MHNNKIIRMEQVLELTQLSRATIYRLMLLGEFPRQIRLAKRSSAWVEQEVLDYIEGRINQRT